MIARILLLLLGLSHLINGFWMLTAPDSWYAAIPGVPATGPLNHHFVEDVGMAFVASGGLLAVGASTTARAGAFAIAGAVWPLLHSFIHISGWFMHGIPAEPKQLFTESVGVIGLSTAGGVLAWLRNKGET
jgi:hypothetical protein